MKKVKVETYNVAPHVFVKFYPRYNDVEVMLYGYKLDPSKFTFQYLMEGKLCYTKRIAIPTATTKSQKMSFFKELVIGSLSSITSISEL